jgi:hypothetical protein
MTHTKSRCNLIFWWCERSIPCTTPSIFRHWWHLHRSLLQKDVQDPGKEVWHWYPSTLSHGNGKDAHQHGRTAPDGAHNNLTRSFESHYALPPKCHAHPWIATSITAPLPTSHLVQMLIWVQFSSGIGQWCCACQEASNSLSCQWWCKLGNVTPQWNSRADSVYNRKIWLFETAEQWLQLEFAGQQHILQSGFNILISVMSSLTRIYCDWKAVRCNYYHNVYNHVVRSTSTD